MLHNYPKPILLATLLVATIAACGAPVAAAPAIAYSVQRIPADKWPADALEFVGGNPGGYATRVPAAPGLNRLVTVVVAASGPEPTAKVGFSVEPARDSPAGERWDAAGFELTLSAGEVVPMLGAVYKVTDVSGNKDRVALARFTDAELLNEIGVDSDSAAAPLKMAVNFAFGLVKGNRDRASITVKRIAPAAGEKPVEAHIALEYSGSSYLRPGLEEADVTVGDDVRLPRGVKLTVRRIVPPDEKRKIVGWVELSPKPTDKPGKKWVGHP